MLGDLNYKNVLFALDFARKCAGHLETCSKIRQQKLGILKHTDGVPCTCGYERADEQLRKLIRVLENYN
jgi:hypothetical protein